MRQQGLDAPRGLGSTARSAGEPIGVRLPARDGEARVAHGATLARGLLQIEHAPAEQREHEAAGDQQEHDGTRGA